MSGDRASEQPSPTPGGDLAAGRATYMLHLLAAASIYRDRHLDLQFEPLGLTVHKYRALLAIARFEGCTMKELAQFTFIDRTTLTRTVDQLVKTGWVTREHAARDRRQVVLNLTPAGYEQGYKAVDVITATNDRAAAALSPAAIEAAIDAVQAVLSNLIPDPEQLERVLTMRRKGAGES